MPPKSSTPKIIIKPLAKRRGRPPRLKVAPPPSPSPVGSIPEDPEPDDDANDGGGDQNSNDGVSRASSSQLPSASQTPGPSVQDEDEDDKGDAEGEGVSTPGGDDADADGDVDVEADAAEPDDAGGAKAKKTRGRPRGRPRGSGTGTPRARGRGRGRARGRGRGSITIRLPKRTGEEGQEEGAQVTTQATEEVPEREESTGPIAGGKPFRTVQGKVYIIENDELVTDDDPKGDTKIDINGNLLGGRKFKAHTFALPNRHPERQYMLAIDAARTSGFRDSLYYFRRNLLAMKLNATQWEKDHLIEQGKLGSHLRTRSVTLVTARSAFKLHGSKMLLDGKWVVDDYYEDKVLEDITAKGLKAGDLVGELQDPNAPAQQDQSLLAVPSNAASKADRGGGSGGSMYRPGGATTIFGGSGWGPYSDGPLNAVRKSLLTRDGLNEENWMLIAAQRALEADEEWGTLRRENLRACGGILGDIEEETKAAKRGVGEVEGAEVAEESKKRKFFDDGPYPMGVYEPQTGIVLYRSDTQPTTSRWEAVPSHKPVLGGSKVGSAAWGLAWVDTVMEVPVPQQSSGP